jgi:7-cyano-7-deazaguanine synthase
MCEARGVDEAQADIYFGAHAEDAQNWAYPDCTPEFIGAMANAIFVGTYRAVRLISPIMFMTKAQIVAMGDKLNVPFDKTWSCYKGGEKHCGKCPTCYARKDAFAVAGVRDPTVYEFNS